ncbi:uronyl 2-sulfotransferase-like [Glandiceps talaboti]
MVTPSNFIRLPRHVYAGVVVLVTTCVFLYAYDNYSLPTRDFNIEDGSRSTNDVGHNGCCGNKDLAKTSRSTNDLVFYNKVGKCGSRSLVYLLRLLSARNGFTAAGENKTPNVTIYLTLDQQSVLVQRISDLSRPATFYRHTHFIDFTRFGYENPIYINIVRQPLSRLISDYYFRRFGDEKKSKDNFKRTSMLYQTFDECVLRNRVECKGDSIFYIIPYFCGQDSRCRNTSQWALDRAMENVEKYFSVIGLSEEYEDTLKLYEATLPEIFKGALEIYKTPGSIRSTKTKNKTGPSPEVVEIMNERLALENEFYVFIKRRFYDMKRKYGLTS